MLISRNGIADANILEGMFDDTTQSSENSTYATSGTSYFKDDFESGLGKWLVSGNDWGLTTSTSHSENNSATDTPSGNYPESTDLNMILANSIDLSASTSPILTFWHKYNTLDYIYVDISTDGGFTWKAIASWYGDLSTWNFVQIDLSNYKNSDVKIKFRLHSVGANVADGWYIDDVIIKEKNVPIPTPTPSPTSSPSPTPTVQTDTEEPIGSIVINSGVAYTKSTSVTLSLSATDGVGVTGYYLSESSSKPTSSASGWTTVSSTTSYSASISYTLSSGDGTKTVYVWYKDAAGNVSSSANDSITLDTTAPTITITSPTSSSTYTTTIGTISLSGSASDNASGISSVTWSGDKGSSGTASGTTGWSISSINLTSGDNVITVTATDSAGNTGTDVLPESCTK